MPDRDGVCCGGDVVAAHIRWGSGAGMGQKPSDSLTVPLCFMHHGYQHQKGELYFWGDKLQEAKDLARGIYNASREDAINLVFTLRGML